MTELPPVDELLAHRPPALVLDAVTSFAGELLVCTATLRELPYGRHGVVRPVALLEHMAQAVAVYQRLSALKTSPAAVDRPRRGYLVAVADFVLADVEVRVGDHLSVEAERVYAAKDLGRFASRVFRGSRGSRGTSLVAEARLTVYRPDRP